MEDCLAGIENRVTDYMNQNLLRTFEASEIDFALSQLHLLKSLGPDGFAAVFFQKSLPTIRNEVCHAALDFLNGGSFDEKINETYICLIPKIKNPSQIMEYCPISLCNVIYKLISKVLDNRMKRILATIISPNQIAFIPGRLITDNILVAFKALYTMDTRMKGKGGYMTLKLDMSKAYDKMEWAFLEAIMRKLGFADRWANLTMTCVCTVSYSVLINGQPYGRINPSRGPRQGDPLSPYFFILCVEGLTGMLNRAERERGFTSLPLTRGRTTLNHLFFCR